MSGLNASLMIALSALAVSQQEMETTSNNVANANTPGYTREVSVVAAGDPVEIGSLSVGTGVVLDKIESLRDSMLQIQINQATQQNSSLNASLQQLKQIQTQFASSTSGIGADISNFFNSLQQLSPNPSDLTLRQGVLTAADTLATDFNTAAQNLQTQRANVDQNVVQTVTEVNSLTSQIASVDQQISNLQSINQAPGALVDQQNNLIQQLSALVDVQVIPTGQGITVATANGTTLVSGSQSTALTTQVGSNGMHDIMAGAQDITSSLTGGSLAGLIQIRDQEISSIGTSLDQLASGLATALNTANAQGYDLNGNQGGNIFAPPPAGGVGAAAALMALKNQPADAQAAFARSIAAAERWRQGGANSDQVLNDPLAAPAGVPLYPASTTFATLDPDGNAVVCALTMNNLFGTGRIVPGLGFLAAASPTTVTPPLLAMALAWNGRSFHAEAGGSGQAGASLAAAAAQLERPGVPLEPRRLWPTSMEVLGVPVRGKIPPGESVEAGRALARFTDIGYGPRVRALVGEGVPDGEVPDALVRAVVEVLSAWREEWPERPAGVVSVGSGTRPRLVADLAGRIAGIGHLPYLGPVDHRGPGGAARSNSAQRLRAVWDAYRPGEELEAAVGGDLAGRPLFLVDDLIDSGWTMTVVGRLLRRAGAGPVYPLALGVVA